MQKYDFHIIGAGLFGAIFANVATRNGYKCLVLEANDHIGGNCYTENKNGIEIHRHGAHIFHTDNKDVWDYVNKYAEFNQFINQPVAVVDDETYNLPFNMNMFSKLFGITRPDDAIKMIREETRDFNYEPRNLEEQAIKLVGRTIYEKFIKGYTEKQWGRKCHALPTDIIKRVPVRFTYDNNYFNDKYQGIPKEGYTKLIEKLLEGSEVILNVKKEEIRLDHKCVIYTGRIDEACSYTYGPLEYRTLEFVDMEYNTENYQGCAVMNYPSLNIPYTRSIEHRHFNNVTDYNKTIVSYEFSKQYNHNDEKSIPYYPIGNVENLKRYKKYKKLVSSLDNVHFAGRLGEYKYYDMDDTVEKALELFHKII